jgi:PKD repeat protein
VKWTIQHQIDDPDGDLGYMGTPPAAPWICWGPYLWTDGTKPLSNGIFGRSDGLTWECGDIGIGDANDVRHMQGGGGGADYVHPARSDDPSDGGLGRKKVADQLFAFLKTDPTATPWFLKKPGAQPPTAMPTASPSSGQPGVTVTFHANAADTLPGFVKETLWTFDDGDYSLSADPVKLFPAPGSYKVHLTVIDDQGNAIFKTKTIAVTQ